MKLEDITISTDGVDWQKCLQHWGWLLHPCPEFSIYLVTKFAEIIAIDDNGAIWFLSTSGASFKKIATSESELFELLENQEEFEFHFMPQVISLLEEANMNLSNDECYGFITPSVFEECTYEVNNFIVRPVEAYLIGLGDMLGKLKDTENGQTVSYSVTS